jgi:NarL family two-component system response regulator LiaR
MGKSRVLVIDDHAIVRKGVAMLLAPEPDLELVGEASNGEEGVQKALALKPDVIMMDLVMPVMDGITATQTIIKQNPQASILVITSYSEKDKAVQAVRAGAIGFILKDVDPEEILQAVRTVAQGRPWLSAELTRLLVHPATPEGFQGEVLTEREQDVLKWIACGFSDQEISTKLMVSKATVRYHVKNIFSKLCLENRTQAALYAIRQGWVTF